MKILTFVSPYCNPSHCFPEYTPEEGKNIWVYFNTYYVGIYIDKTTGDLKAAQ